MNEERAYQKKLREMARKQINENYKKIVDGVDESERERLIERSKKLNDIICSAYKESKIEEIKNFVYDAFNFKNRMKSQGIESKTFINLDEEKTICGIVNNLMYEWIGQWCNNKYIDTIKTTNELIKYFAVLEDSENEKMRETAKNNLGYLKEMKELFLLKAENGLSNFTSEGITQIPSTEQLMIEYMSELPIATGKAREFLEQEIISYARTLGWNPENYFKNLKLKNAKKK